MDIQELRAALERQKQEVASARSAEKASQQRRVYTLPPDLLRRVMRYQLDECAASEVAAVRALLEIGLATYEHSRRPVPRTSDAGGDAV